MDFNVRSIHRSKNQPTIHRKFHIASPRGLSTRSWNVLTQLRSRNYQLSIRDPVVRQKNYFEQAPSLSIIVQYRRNLVDKLDDVFGIFVSWSSFAWKHHNSRNNMLSLFRRHLFDSQVTINNVKYVHKLPFVLMNSFYMDIEQGILVYYDSAILMHPFC